MGVRRPFLPRLSLHQVHGHPQMPILDKNFFAVLAAKAAWRDAAAAERHRKMFSLFFPLFFFAFIVILARRPFVRSSPTMKRPLLLSLSLHPIETAWGGGKEGGGEVRFFVKEDWGWEGWMCWVYPCGVISPFLYVVVRRDVCERKNLGKLHLCALHSRKCLVLVPVPSMVHKQHNPPFLWWSSYPFSPLWTEACLRGLHSMGSH